jgi:hypothetical protein
MLPIPYSDLKGIIPFLRHTANAALLCGSLLVGHNTSAQVFYPAANPDHPAASNTASNVENTGNDHVPLADQTLRVMCWDGDKPGLGWSFSPNEAPGATGNQYLIGTQFGKVTDPDIVADPGNFGRTGLPFTTVLVAYVLDGGIYYEVHQYDAPSNTMTDVTPSPVLLAAPDEKGSNPNVDVDGEGHAVITWAAHGRIFAQVYDMPNATLYPRCEIAGQDGFDCSQPDVAVNLGSEDIVSFIYIVTDPQGQQTVHMYQNSRQAVESYASLNSGLGRNVLPNRRGFYEAPRIAAPPDYTPFGTCDLEAVVADRSTNEIIGLNRTFTTNNLVNFGSLPTVNVLNSIGGLYQRVNCTRPVVSYCFDVIEVAWTLRDGTLFGGRVRNVRNGSEEIVQCRLDYFTGAFVTGSQPTPGYSIVNQEELGRQSVPSVAGRYAAFVSPQNANTGKAFYCFTEEGKSEVYYKSSYYYNVNLRTAVTPSPPLPIQPVTAYPNPFQQETTLTLTLAEGEVVRAVEVYDPTGQPVRNLKLPTAKTKGPQQLRWDAAGLRPGLYLVRVRTNTGALYTYRLQHE